MHVEEPEIKHGLQNIWQQEKIFQTLAIEQINKHTRQAGSVYKMHQTHYTNFFFFSWFLWTLAQKAPFAEKKKEGGVAISAPHQTVQEK